MSQPSFRVLPSADRLLRASELQALIGEYSREAVLWLVRDTLGHYRRDIAAGGLDPAFGDIVARIIEQARTRWSPPGKVINATGVILHTNLGRAPLSDAAVNAMTRAAGQIDLEIDLESGERSSRQSHVEWLLRAITRAEAAVVTVNNAAAVLLALRAIAGGKDVLVSRGQAVEIGGGFRIPAILRQSGARLVEVGTTNRTRPEDFEEAWSERTGALLQVHSSNFRIVGFSESVSLRDMSQIAHRRQVPLIVDNGSGALLPTERFGLAHEPTPQEALTAGADMVAFSGDKLLGGPQAGILIGNQDLIDRVRRHPLARALRPDKLILAALSATLLAYLRGNAVSEIPVWQMIAQSHAAVCERAVRWKVDAENEGLEVALRDDVSTVGGGSLPGETLPTTLILLPSAINARRLRHAIPPVFARSRGGRACLDLRTVNPIDDSALLAAVQQAVADEIP